MLKSLEYMNYLLNCNGNLDYTLNGKKVFYISEDILESFKQDLEKYDKALELINDLFNNIHTMDIFGKHVFICKMNNRSMQIDRPTQIKLQELKKLVGDNHD